MAKRAVKRIKNLKVYEASLVDRPANPGAQILLWKRADSEEDEPEELEEMEQVAEVDRMLTFAKSGVTTHSWSDRDVSEAMEALAARLSPELPIEVALEKHFGDDRMARLYELYRSAAPAEAEPAEVAKQHEQTPAERQIEALARKVMAANAGWTLERAISHVMSTAEGIRLYGEHRRQLTERYARRGGVGL
jgi:hypothetical protein